MTHTLDGNRNSQLARAVCAIASTLAVCAGCGRSQPPRLPVHAVSGQAFVDGRAVAGAEVYFNPHQPIEGLRTIPLARVAADGSFAPGTYDEHDGLPAGQYDLTILWPKRTVIDGEEITGDDQLMGRFSDPRRPVANFTVQEGGSNVIPRIELKGG